MWILHFLPDSFLALIVNTILVIGVVGSFFSFVILNNLLRFFPPLANYYRILQIVSIVLLVTGVYLKGGYSTEMMWRERVAELESKLKEAEAKSSQVNTVVQTKVVNKIKEVQVQGEKIVEYIDREVVKYDNTCTIPKEVIKAHNAAVVNKPVEETK